MRLRGEEMRHGADADAAGGMDELSLELLHQLEQEDRAEAEATARRRAEQLAADERLAQELQESLAAAPSVTLRSRSIVPPPPPAGQSRPTVAAAIVKTPPPPPPARRARAAGAEERGGGMVLRGRRDERAPEAVGARKITAYFSPSAGAGEVPAMAGATRSAAVFLHARSVAASASLTANRGSVAPLRAGAPVGAAAAARQGAESRWSSMLHAFSGLLGR
jgi:hypothetical protein